MRSQPFVMFNQPHKVSQRKETSHLTGHWFATNNATVMQIVFGCLKDGYTSASGKAQSGPGDRVVYYTVMYTPSFLTPNAN